MPNTLVVIVSAILSVIALLAGLYLGKAEGLNEVIKSKTIGTLYLGEPSDDGMRELYLELDSVTVLNDVQGFATVRVRSINRDKN